MTQTQATMKNSSNEPAATPLPRPQAQASQPWCFSHSVSDLSSGGNFCGQRKAVDCQKNSTENRSARPSGFGQLQPNNANDKRKKSVRFQFDVTLYGLNPAPVPCGMPSEEKQLLWYGADDFDRFKRGAAQDAGVTIARSGKKEAAEEGRRFVVAGDFDGRFDGIGTENGASNGTAAGRARYNENEYNDSPGGDGGAVCRRGLGHHFSRARRRSRAIARSAVAAWQRSLLAGAAEGPREAAVAGSAPGGDERVRLTLALVSTRCSRRARAEAQWRGDVDYRVAHPERHVDDVGAPTETSLSKPLAEPLAKPLARAESDDGSPVERMAGKRDCAPCIVASCDGAGRKRRRTAGGGPSPLTREAAGCFERVRKHS